MPGVSGVSGVSVIPFGGKATGSFSLDDITFTAGMAKRIGPSGVFDAAPIVQGYRVDSGYQDHIQTESMTILGNPFGYMRDFVDLHQGSIGLLITPEWDGDNGLAQYIWAPSGNYLLRKTAADELEFFLEGSTVATDISAWNAGDTHLVIVSWDVKNTIDGTNYVRLSIDNSHTYGISTQPSISTIFAAMRIGGYYSPHANRPANAIVEGMFVSRRVLYDSNGYGTPPIDLTDELSAIYNSGSFEDAASIFGGWDCTFFLPTDCDSGVATCGIATGTGEAWSMPHDSIIEEVPFMSDGGLPGTTYATEFDGSTSEIDCGSGATLDDLGAGGATFQAEVWFRCDLSGTSQVLMSKGYSAAGWGMYIYSASSAGTLYGYVNLATTNAAAFVSSAVVNCCDGKWHHAVLSYNDATKSAQVAIDGKWGSANVGAGAYTTDVATNLYFGRANAGTLRFEGGMAWSRIWNAAQYTPGTDFIPPRTFSSVGTVESWQMDDGTGNTVTASITSPGNDGTLVGSWSRIWEQEGTPVIPQSFYFDSSTSQITRAAAAAINDLPATGITYELWMRADSINTGSYMIMQKGFGWTLWSANDVDDVRATIYYDTTSQTAITTGGNIYDGAWHHIAVTYDETGDRKVRLFVDGVLRAITDVTVGNYSSDAANSIFVHNASLGARHAGQIGWVRISDTVRYANGNTVGQAYFGAPHRCNPPTPDGNTALQWNMTDGAGTTVTDSSGGGLNGTITPGNGYWLNTPDLEEDSPGERVYPWGYSIGSDAVDEGITILENVNVTAGTSYVVRATISIGNSGGSWPQIVLYDNTGAANIVTFDGPRIIGQHTGANNAASLTDSNTRWVQNLAGWTIQNATDRSKATITSNSEQNIVGALAGGTDNDWDTNDWYILKPPSYRSYSRYPWQESFVFTAPAGCTSIDVKVINQAAVGITHIHQVEIYESLLPNGDMEAGAGNPWLPTGWANLNLDPGDTTTTATSHSGSQAMDWTVGATNGEGMYDGTTLTANNFYLIGFWGYKTGAVATSMIVESGGTTQAHRHEDASAYISHNTGLVQTSWRFYPFVYRAVSASVSWYFRSWEAQVKYLDDAFLVAMNDVTLTVVPATEANSLESGGIRCDGFDRIQLPAGAWFDREGSFRWGVVVRHGIDITDELQGYSGVLLELRLDGNNYLYVSERNIGGNPIYIGYNAAGAGAQAAEWVPGATWTPGNAISLRLDYGTFGVKMWANGVLVINSAPPCRFDAAPTVRQMGSGTTTWFGSSPDIVITAP